MIRTLGIVAKSNRSGLIIKNGSATLLNDSSIVATVLEERLTRQKADAGCSQAAGYILNHLLNGDPPDHVVVSSCCEPAEDAYSEDLADLLFLRHRITRSPSHHFSHALMGYYLSPFDRALIAVVDAGGSTLGRNRNDEWWSLPREQASFYIGEGSTIRLVHRCFDQPNQWGIGEAYRAFTKFLGFGGQTQSGKTMGLAAFSPPFQSPALFDLQEEGQLRSRLIVHSPSCAEEGVQRFLTEAGISAAKRQSTDPLLDIHAQIAAIVQSETERAIAHTVGHLLRRHSLQNICFVGGVALNIGTNAKLLDIPGVDGLFVPPCPGDDGQSIGNALIPLYETRPKERPRVEIPSAFLGLNKSYSIDSILGDLESAGPEFELLQETEDFRLAAELISEGLILGWFQGRSEIGPRALGHRSILADPRRRETRDRLSHWIKGRDPFRPYAASVLQEEARAWFDLKADDPFMLLPARAREHTKRIAPALFHPDGTCRLQTVTEAVPELRRLLLAFQQKTGVPFVVNTSLNLAGMPIAESPEDAFTVLRRSDLDALVIGNKVIQKHRRSVPTDFIRIPEVTLRFGDQAAEARLRLLYPGVPHSRRHNFGLLREYCDWILLGRKTTTVRYTSGCIDLPRQSVLEVIARPGGETVYVVEIEQMRVLPFGNLSHEDAIRDGFSSVDELKAALRRFYGSILDLSPMTVYDVKLCKEFDRLRGRALFHNLPASTHPLEREYPRKIE